jgi:hypothetical protein
MILASKCRDNRRSPIPWYLRCFRKRGKNIGSISMWFKEKYIEWESRRKNSPSLFIIRLKDRLNLLPLLNILMDVKRL